MTSPWRITFSQGHFHLFSCMGMALGGIRRAALVEEAGSLAELCLEAIIDDALPWSVDTDNEDVVLRVRYQGEVLPGVHTAVLKEDERGEAIFMRVLGPFEIANFEVDDEQ